MKRTSLTENGDELEAQRHILQWNPMEAFEAYENWIIHAPDHPSNKHSLITYSMPGIVLGLGMIKI